MGTKSSKKEEIPIPNTFENDIKIEGKFFTIIDKNNVSQNRYVYIGRVNSCRAGGCSIPNESASNTESEYFDYYILFNDKIEVVLVKVFNYQATHGQEVTVKGWLKQFIGYKGNKNLQVGKDIDAIAGATVSVYAITADIEHKTNLLKQITTSTTL
ncbi:MAG: FMN-binding protein [Chloroflexia bacterium]|nr:FMN-binding protein [Chloroflexia bacterium]